MRIQDLESLNAVRQQGLAKFKPDRPRIAVGLGTCGIGNGAEDVFQAFQSAVEARGVEAFVTRTGCFGFCADEPLVNIAIPGKPLVILNKVKPQDADAIVADIHTGTVDKDRALCRIESWDHLTGVVDYGEGFADIPLWNEVDFYNGQKKIVLRNCGLIDPEDIEEYIAVGGYRALLKTLRNGEPERIIEELKTAKLRGRGGAGFLVGTKWEFMRNAPEGTKYVICNADEGDPGAYMNRNEIESDPHNLIEGMIIGAYCMGASEGIVYVRAEYPLAVHRLEKAIAQAQAFGLIGDDILGSGFSFHLSLVEGAGAFVCGEETALIASLEGKAGRPRPRPPYPAEDGLWGKPTNINNVETWYNVPVIVHNGGAWFTQTGTDRSPGTKVFSLVGKIKNTGLVEVPLGTPLKTFVYDIGGGTGNGKAVKALQTGGPSGGCVPVDMFDTPVDYEALAQLGSIMGSGGMVVLDEDNCMVDVARYFTEFTHSESCGKCVPCRVGLDHSLRILNEVSQGCATMGDLDMLEDLGPMIRDTSLCGLGNSAPNPVLTTLRYFRHEFEDHIEERNCAAGVCEDLFLSPCENSCPLHMNIPRFIQLYKENRLEDAFESVIMDNPLPASTGRVCQHPCDDRCRRAGIDSAVNMREIHRFIADSVYGTEMEENVMKRILSRKMPESGRKVAIVGAGPTGLAGAFYLALLGHKVTVFDENSEPGGMLRFALPEYRLPKAVVAAEVDFIERLGVEFICNTRIGVDRTPRSLSEDFDSVFLALGTWEAAPIDLPGVQCEGVHHALHFLDEVAHENDVRIGQRVVVIGGGNAAIDSARTAIRKGADVTVVYRRQRDDMPAIPEEVDEAEEEAVKFVYLASPHR
ncbi:MAG: FAD-dependent oxidoreductase, partial [Rhodospirillales bacterium]|nr:FAD-dependent oxidoreductase [Rhodospirillales bacterium]